jgi:purine-binding chemotaxis protein CheW
MGTLLATFTIGEHLCAVPAAQVQEVLMGQPRTPTPGAPPAIAGLINLRGQVVSALDLRLRMGINLAGREDQDASMSVVVRSSDEVWSLLVDRIGDVIEVSEKQFELPPDTLTGNMRELIKGAYKLDGQLLLVLDVLRVLDVSPESALV